MRNCYPPCHASTGTKERGCHADEGTMSVKVYTESVPNEDTYTSANFSSARCCIIRAMEAMEAMPARIEVTVATLRSKRF